MNATPQPTCCATERRQEGVPKSAEAGDEPSVVYYLEALAAVATPQDNPEYAVRLLAAAGALLRAKAAAGCTHSCPAPPRTLISWQRCAPAWEMRRSSRPGHAASPSEADASLSTR
jgi:hypothetical protein